MMQQQMTTYVREPMSSYSVKVTPMNGIKVSVEPKKLTLEGPKLLAEMVVHGSLSWVHDGGKYIVRSPIVATSLVPDTS